MRTWTPTNLQTVIRQCTPVETGELDAAGRIFASRFRLAAPPMYQSA
jgi:hypothetical protein